MQEKKPTLNEAYSGKRLDVVVDMLKAAGYKIHVVPEGVPVSLMENRDLGRATVETKDGVVVHISIG